MKPIETEYAGCRFRSRTEARWAVFFDALGWPWSFEQEGFELKSGRYLPDFKVWTFNRPDPTWFEVKPYSDKFPEDNRWTELAIGSKTSVLIAYGMHRNGDRCLDAWNHHRMVPHGGRIVTPDGRKYVVGPFWVTPELYHAWDEASRARFEFGESGSPDVTPGKSRKRKQ